MAIFNTYTWFSPDLGDVVSEAWERAGMASTAIGNDHLESILRSMRWLLNSEWLTLGFRQWQFELVSLTTSVGVPSYILPAEVLTVADAVLIRSNRATPINPMSRSDYLEIPDKTQLGRPDRYLVDRQYNQVQLTVWRTPENSTDVIQYWAFKNNSQPGNALQYQLAMPPHVQEAFVSGLSAKIAQKFNQPRFTELQALYRGLDPNPRNIGGALALALDADRESGDVRITMAVRRRGR